MLYSLIWSDSPARYFVHRYASNRLNRGERVNGADDRTASSSAVASCVETATLNSDTVGGLYQKPACNVCTKLVRNDCSTFQGNTGAVRGPAPSRVRGTMAGTGMPMGDFRSSRRRFETSRGLESRSGPAAVRVCNSLVRQSNRFTNSEMQRPTIRCVTCRTSMKILKLSTLPGSPALPLTGRN